MVHVFLLWLHICSCIVFCCLISLIPVLSLSLLKQLLLSYSSDLVGGRTLQTENAVQRWLPFLTTQMWVPLHTWCMVSFFLLKGNENRTELSEENTNSYGVIMTLMILCYLFYHASLALRFKILTFFSITSTQASLNHQYSTQMSTHLALCVCRSWRRTKTGGLPSPSNRSEHFLLHSLSPVLVSTVEVVVFFFMWTGSPFGYLQLWPNYDF